MTSKLQLYDIFSALVPGVLLCAAVAAAFPKLLSLFTLPDVPDAFGVLSLTILALFIGHIVQAVASLLEPVLHKTWGGRPSEKALTEGLGDRYFPTNTSDRVVEKLRVALRSDATPRDLFLYAMPLAEADDKSRASSFNGSYAYHRALFMLSISTALIAAFSGFYGSLKLATCGQYLAIVAVLLALVALLWYRCKQRAFYYVREVLLSAERVLDSRGIAPSHDGSDSKD